MRTLRLVALVGILVACSSDEPESGGNGSCSTTTLYGSLLRSYFTAEGVALPDPQSLIRIS